MRPLVNCLKIHNVDPADISAIQILLKELKDNGYTGNQAEVFAVEGHLTSLENEQADILSKAKEAGAVIPETKKLSPREYQETYPEKTVHEDWNTANSPRYELEAAGDILRELQKEFIDLDYINEKINRINMLKGEVHPDDHIDKARKDQPEKLNKLRIQYQNQPTETVLQEKAKQAILNIIEGKFEEAKKAYNEIVKSLKTSNGQFSVEVPIPEMKTTVDAVEFSKIATPEQLEEVQNRRKQLLQKADVIRSQASEESDRVKKFELMDQFQEVTTQAQFMREVLEAKEAPERFNMEIRETQMPGQGLDLDEIKKIFPNQNVFIDSDKTISIKFKNGKGITIQNVKDAGNDFIEMFIQSGQMSNKGKILGITVGSNIMLDSQFADNKTLWHENKHVLDNLGMITKKDDSALNREFNKLRKAGKLDFALSTHKDPIQAMRENRANMLAQIMTNREDYRNNSTMNKIIQKLLDFFNQLYTIGKRVFTGNKEFQTATSLAKEAESGKLYEREVTEEIIPTIEIQLETREPLPEQKLSDEQYNNIFQQKSNILKKIGQSLRMKLSDTKLMLDKSITPVSTRLKNIGLTDLSDKLRKLDFITSMKITKALEDAYPMMKIARKEMTSEDKSAWDWARKNSDLGKITQFAEKYGFEDSYTKTREALNQIRQDALDVGFDVGFIEDYWPRILKDQEGFLQATQEISKRPVFTEAIKDKADKLGISVNEFNLRYPDVRADIISNIILGTYRGIPGPGNIQGRVFEVIPEEYAKFYMDSDSALMQYLYSMTKKIEARRFFGKVPERISRLKQKRSLAQTELIKLEKLSALENSEPILDDTQQQIADAHIARMDLLEENIRDYDTELEKYKNQRDYTENIGAYINDLMLEGKLHKKNEQAVRDILEARFHERGTTGIVHAYKNLAYIDVMGNPMAAVTQIGDLAWAMYVGNIFDPRNLPSNIKNFTRALFKKSKITKEDLGIERMAQEFADFDSLSNLVSKVFKYTGLEKIDSIGKEVLINNAFDAYKHQASTEAGRTELLKRIRPIFGNKSNEVINDLLANNPSENVKMLLYSRLLDFQPVALSEMPEYYLKGGNWRILYMLKTYTLKQFDVFRNEVWRDLKRGDAKQKLKAVSNMIQLMGLLTLANAGADEIKDFMMGKEVKFSDNVTENFLTMGGANRFVRMQARREGIGTAVSQMILPPVKFVNSLSKDIMGGEITDLKKSRTLESLPFIGKLAYWHVGRGSEYKPTIEEQDFKDAGKQFKKFKDSLEEADDKRVFLQTNLEEFRKMKKYEDFANSISKITTLINKLEKLDQTTSVRKRIGQLKERQKQLRQLYFDSVEK
jgi:hypothetical protein